ncbi:hypothetical protein [Haladaptatus sp. NG-SE-30]
MYTGKTEQPCCLCDDPDAPVRIDLPPSAVPEMKYGDPIAWRDIVGEVSIHFCESDWNVVRDLVLDLEMSPLPRCNVARASFDLREDFEALLDSTRDEPDQSRVESRLREKSERVVAEFGDDSLHSDRDLVEARIVLGTLDEKRA